MPVVRSGSTRTCAASTPCSAKRLRMQSPKPSRADRADEAGGAAQPCDGVDIDRRIAAGKRTGERADLLKRLVQIDAHDLDQHGAQ